MSEDRAELESSHTILVAIGINPKANTSAAQAILLFHNAYTLNALKTGSVQYSAGMTSERPTGEYDILGKPHSLSQPNRAVTTTRTCLIMAQM